MKTNTIIAFLLIILAIGAVATPAQQNLKPVIQMAILLDTSNSMDGLIHQAKSQLWKIVNEFIEAKKNGKKPDLEVALYEYGNNRLSSESGHIRRVLPLTNDLDKVSQELFALTTNGGNEFCGQVIDKATRDLAWSTSSDDLKVIFIAGNEPFTQGTVDYHQSVKAAISKGVVVNTIHCGTEQQGIDGKWKDGALLADGSYLFIDHDKASISIEAPQDKQLAELGERLNKTYIAYGVQGKAGLLNQHEQDKNARSASVNNAANRAIFKSAAQYNSAAWDLVDAIDKGTVKMSSINEKDLPESMQKMNRAEQKTYIDGKRAERNRIQAEISKLNNERKVYIAAKMKEQAGAETDTLDSAMVKTIQSIMVKKSFQSGQ
ncbi:MAG: VWA domain-containing protein [Acidobacteria bacterium]|nr:VWA domain-containing protein [Acidobacteriota bacterium]